MNARTTTLLIVLALALAACVAPMPAPPPRVQPPSAPEQTLPMQQTPAQNKLPATQVTQPDDAQAAALLAAQQQLVSELMIGVPPQARPYIETYAAIEVVRQQTATMPDALTSAQKQLISELMIGVPPQARPYIEAYAVVEVARQQKGMALPELTATNPKSREVQAMDDLLKPEVLPAESMATKIALLEHAAQTVPPQVREAIYDTIETLELPASQMPVRDQWYLDQ